MNFELASWPLWVSLALIATISYVLFTKPMKVSSPKGKHFSNPIHTHPLFKLGCVFVIGFLLFLLTPFLFR